MAASSSTGIVHLESIEPRLLLSFASLSSHGTLSVVGTGGSDSITVQFSGTKVQAILNGNTLSFNKSDVKRIFAEGFGGNDSVTNKTSLPGTILGDGGNDSLIGGTGVDEINAGTGADHLSGGGGGQSAGPMNKLILNGQDDVIDYSHEAAGTFDGTDPDPSVPYFITYRNNTAADQIVRQGAFSIVLTSGNDTFHSSAIDTALTVNLGKGNDRFITLAGVMTRVEGGDGNDVISINADSAVRQILLGAGNDRIDDNYGGTLTTLIDGGSGTDTWNLNPDDIQQTTPYQRDVPAGVENMTIGAGQSGAVIVFGNSLNNVIKVTASGGTAEVHGGAGNDRIEIGAVQGMTHLYGDSGNDTFVGSAFGPDVFSGGGGNDTVDYSARTEAISVKIDNKANDGSAADALDNTPGAPRDDVRSDVENVIGGSGGDFLQGNPFANKLVGNAGNDTIFGGDGNDTLFGGPGTDHLDGQGGTDVIMP